MRLIAAALGCVFAFSALAPPVFAQAFSAHSTSLGVSTSDGSPPVVYNPNRDVHLTSVDGSAFKLQFPGCTFDVDGAALSPEVEDVLRPSFEKHFAGVGWIGEIAFIGTLTNPVRNDITKPLLHAFECDTSEHAHVIAISRWTGDTVLEQLGVLTRFAIIDYQVEPSTLITTKYFVALRVDVITLENIENLSALARAITSGLIR